MSIGTINHDLLKKYNVPVPRYTSYPTVPYWQQTPPTTQDWLHEVINTFQQDDEISLYIHLPFCEKLCTYCGCNKRITKNHKVEKPYIDTLLKEWQLYLEVLPHTPKIKEIHLGGGTPTFFTPQNLHYLLHGLLANVKLADTYEFSFEVHPSSTSIAHLQTLYDLGFRRVSIGVQDFDPHILTIINRPQTYEQVVNVTEAARSIGYTSVNYDLIFGLPTQTKAHIINTINKVSTLKPDRIAFYSYAHIPWVSPGQRAYSEKDLPTDSEKRALYELGRTLLEENGYREIGMDHFALETDELYQAMQRHEMHRNFMGYTAQHTQLMIGLGASAISDAWSGFVQNIKKVEDYAAAVNRGEFPFYRGHILDQEDKIIRRHITNIMCHSETSWLDSHTQCGAIYEGIDRMLELEVDGLVRFEPFKMTVTEKGRPFLRNICTALDARLWRNKPQTRLFSMAV